MTEPKPSAEAGGGRGETRDRLLDAAAEVVLARGALGLTLEAVAKAAGVSKGGLLYHFASKEALLRAMVNRLVEATEARIAASCRAEAAGGGATPQAGAWLRGYLTAWTGPEGAPESDRRLGQALLAASAVDPALLDELRAQDALWGQRLRTDGLDPLLALILRLAIDGLWFNETLGIEVVSAEERRALAQRLEEMTRS